MTREEFLRRGRVTITEACWLWGRKLVEGYGRLNIAGTFAPAHRLSYELWRSPIPEGLVIDHLCRVRNCVNPDHLEPVTNATNILRGEGLSARRRRQTSCARGHALAGENLYAWVDDGGRTHRRCVACRNVTNQGFVRSLSPEKRAARLEYFRSYNATRRTPKEVPCPE